MAVSTVSSRGGVFGGREGASRASQREFHILRPELSGLELAKPSYHGIHKAGRVDVSCYPAGGSNKIT